ncbi:TetR/AcrR family transcriptional regulator [Nitratireductor rhodophyticola]|uniref:TetR family transcriptional regulator n=1 Tax=Nitratireductor rhodophyticola TaxID=2854036 RepID=UPI000814186B|nr:TetR/AcrR family transcriptional regulator [Nitratireductor rhodophyticola]MEC9246029.1 TetR/AcrR family transcriptional regulator [Pseudomonadota bacterium]WPZ14523.1 TetR/AcrR family transcriptional regulator [Nitratireductor rhodophyticola]
MTETETPGAIAARRMPTQKRARERVERILDVARGIIAESGSEAMKMSEVAQRAGISIGSLYQYFPDKAAIIRTLAEHYNALGRACICDGLEEVHDLASLRKEFTALIDEYYAMFLSEPVMRDIWSGTQADKTLSLLDLEDARANAQELAQAMLRASPERDPDSTASTALLIIHLGEATMRLAIQVGEAEGRRLVEDYKRIALREMLG